MRKVLQIGLLSVFAFAAVGFFQVQNARTETPSVLRFLKGKPETQGPDLALKAEHGPWLIYATSLEGPDSKLQAIALAIELRNEFGLNAYIMPKTFDFSNKVVGSGLSETGKQKIMQYADDRVVECYSILVGDFTSVDAPQTKEVLKKIKTIKPKFFATETMAEKIDDVTPGEMSVAYRVWLKQKSSNDIPGEAVSPMINAFITRNPLLPEEFYNAPELEEFVVKLNERAENSILKCPGRFTVRIANFTGSQTTLLSGGSNSSTTNSLNGAALEEAAIQANLLASLLRRAGYEAYEFHDRSCSSVCVGNFESLGAVDASGTFVYSPEIMKVVADFGGVKDYRISQYGPVPVAKTLLDVVNYKKYPELTVGTEAEKMKKVKEYSLAFEANPKPIFVPKSGTKSLYNKSLLGRK